MKQQSLFNLASTTRKTNTSTKKRKSINTEPLEGKLTKKIILIESNELQNNLNQQAVSITIPHQKNTPEQKNEVINEVTEGQQVQNNENLNKKKVQKQKAKDLLDKYKQDIDSIKNEKQQLIDPQQQIQQIKIQEILGQPSIRQRYEELLLDQSAFILPAHFKDLFDFFTDLDSVLDHLLQDNKTTYFDDVKEMFENFVKKRCNIETIQRIMSVGEDFFDITYQQRIKSYQLIIKQNLNGKKIADLKERKDKFKKNLIQKTQELHWQFLQTIGETQFIEEQAFSHHCLWHPKFNAHEIPNFQMKPLPEKPSLHTIDGQPYRYKQPIQNLLSDLKQDKIKSNDDAIQRLIEESKHIKIENNTTGIDDRILAMIRHKEQKLKEKEQEDLINNKDLVYTNNIGQIKQVFELLKIYFFTKNTSSVFIVQIIENLKISLINLTLNEIKNLVEQMVSLVDFCFALMQHKEGTILIIKTQQIQRAQAELNRLSQQNQKIQK